MIFLPKTLFQASSRHNPNIRVVEEWGGVKVLVNGSRQSGPDIKKLWLKAFRALRLHEMRGMTSLLVLGIGGGTVIKLLSTMYPAATITAVDIDSVMIDIAKRYFHIDHIPHLHIVRSDARTFVRSRRRFDCVIVDLFCGRDIPPFVSTSAFYQRLKEMMRPGGSLLVNFLREFEYQQKSDALRLTLKRHFSVVDDFSLANNRFFLCRT